MGNDAADRETVTEPGDPGDLGRRVALRRNELGLGREELALRAGMDAGYLKYVEESRSAAASPTTLYRLAVALDTTVDHLAGVGFGEAVGSGHPPGGTATVEDLDQATCLALLSNGGIGRIVFMDGRRPVALPVNFRSLDESLVFRTGGDGSIRSAVETNAVLSLEADHLDDTLGEGWSVLVSGHAEVVSDHEQVNRIDGLGIESWAGGERPAAVRLSVEQITGRRIRRHL